MRVLLCLLGLAVAVPAYAGHGTIEETDECFIVEWTGDASDKAPDTKQQGQKPVRVTTQPVRAAGAAAQRVAPARQQIIGRFPGSAQARGSMPVNAVTDETMSARRNRKARGAAAGEAGENLPKGRHE